MVLAMYIDSILMFNRYVKVLFMCLNKMMMFILTISLLPLEICLLFDLCFRSLYASECFVLFSLCRLSGETFNLQLTLFLCSLWLFHEVSVIK